MEVDRMARPPDLASAVDQLEVNHLTLKPTQLPHSLSTIREAWASEVAQGPDEGDHGDLPASGAAVADGERRHKVDGCDHPAIRGRHAHQDRRTLPEQRGSNAAGDDQSGAKARNGFEHGRNSDMHTPRCSRRVLGRFRHGKNNLSQDQESNGQEGSAHLRMYSRTTLLTYGIRLRLSAWTPRLVRNPIELLGQLRSAPHQMGNTLVPTATLTLRPLYKYGELERDNTCVVLKLAIHHIQMIPPGTRNEC